MIREMNFKSPNSEEQKWNPKMSYGIYRSPIVKIGVTL